MLCGCYLQQAEHGVAYVEAVPPVVIGDGPVTLPHCVHPSGQRLGWREGGGGDYRTERKRRQGAFTVTWLCCSFVPVPKETHSDFTATSQSYHL